MNKDPQPQIKAKSTLMRSFTPILSGLIQRKCACGAANVAGACESCKQNSLNLQPRATSQSEFSSLPEVVDEALRSPGRPLDLPTRSFMEPRFGHNFSNVRVHTDEKSAEAAQAINAKAFTVGEDIFFGPGMYFPESRTGRELIAHELTHVTQSYQGNIRTQPSAKLHISNPTDVLEREADMMASRVVTAADNDIAADAIRLKFGSSSGNSGLLLRDEIDGSKNANPSNQEKEVGEATPAQTSQTALGTFIWGINQWTTNVRRSRDFTVSQNGSVSISGTLFWVGPSRCNDMAAEVQVILYRKRSFIWDSNEGEGSLTIGRASTINWSNLPEGTYYIEISVVNGDPEHCSLSGSLTVNAT